MQANKDTIKEMLKPILERLEKGEKFVLEQSPEICKEIIKEKVFLNGIFGTIFLLSALLVITITPVIVHILAKASGDRDLYVLNMFIILALIPLISGIDYIYKAILAHLTPKLTILKELSNLIKN